MIKTVFVLCIALIAGVSAARADEAVNNGTCVGTGLGDTPSCQGGVSYASLEKVPVAQVVSQAKAALSKTTLTVTSTAIVDNVKRACASKQAQTEDMIKKAEAADADLQGRLSAQAQITQVPGQVYDSCAYKTTSGDQDVCVGQYEDGMVDACAMTLTVTNPAYRLSLKKMENASPAQLEALRQSGSANIVFSDVDGVGRRAQWVVVEKK